MDFARISSGLNCIIGLVESEVVEEFSYASTFPHGQQKMIE